MGIVNLFVLFQFLHNTRFLLTAHSNFLSLMNTKRRSEMITGTTLLFIDISSTVNDMAYNSSVKLDCRADLRIHCDKRNILASNVGGNLTEPPSTCSKYYRFSAKKLTIIKFYSFLSFLQSWMHFLISSSISLSETLNRFINHVSYGTWLPSLLQQ